MDTVFNHTWCFKCLQRGFVADESSFVRSRSTQLTRGAYLVCIHVRLFDGTGVLLVVLNVFYQIINTYTLSKGCYCPRSDVILLSS